MTHTPWVPSAPHLLLRGVGTPGWVRPRSPQRPGEVGTEAPPGEAQQQTGPGTHVSPVRPREPQPRVGGGRGARRDRPLPAGSQTSAGHVPPSPSPSWRPRRSTCSWRPPAARPCPAWPCSSPRACPPRSCTRCQVGRAGPNPSGAEAAPRCQSGPESKTGHGVGWGRGRWGQVGCRGGGVACGGRWGAGVGSAQPPLRPQPPRWSSPTCRRLRSGPQPWAASASASVSAPSSAPCSAGP